MALVGREQEARLIADRLAEAGHGRGRIVLIEGEAGSGKTTLIRQAVDGARAEGFTVFNGAGHEIDRARPFGVAAAALGIRTAAGDRARSSIARDLRTAGKSGMDEGQRYALLEDFLDLLERDALARPVLLALDDVHWADDPTMLMLHHLHRRVAQLPICVVATRRPPRTLGEPDQLDSIVAEGDTTRIRLAPLSADDVADLAAQLLGLNPGPGLLTMLGKAGGNPFFVIELLGALREDRSIDVTGRAADMAIVDSRPELRMVILRRLRGLAPRTTDVLRMAAVLGETFSARDLALSLGTTPAELVAPLDEAFTSGVIHAEGDRLAFRHDLVREALYGDIPVSMRNALHLEIAHALRRAHAAPRETAPHFEAGAAIGDDEAVESLRAAAAEVASTDPEAARRWLSRAMALMPEADERHDALVLDLCRLLLRLGESAKAEGLAREALTRPQPGERRAALVRTLAAALDLMDRCLDAAAASEAESHALDLGPVEQIRLAAEGVEYRGHMQRGEAEAEAREVLERALAIGDEVAIKAVQAALYHSAMWRGAFHDAVLLAEKIIAGPAADGGLIVFTGVAGGALARVGRTTEALVGLRREVKALEARRDVRPMSLILTELAQVEITVGEWDAAISNVEAALGLAREFRQEVRHDEAAALLAILATRRGEHDRAGRLLDGLISSRQFVATPAQALHARATGDHPAALKLLRDAWSQAIDSGRRSDLPKFAPDLVQLELAMGERSRAIEVTEAIEDMARQTGVLPTELIARRCRGLVMRDGVGLLAVADLARDRGWADAEAALLEDAGTLLAEAGQTGEAIAALKRALSYYEVVGAGFDERRTAAALRGLGARLGHRGRRSRAASGWEALTDTERNVVGLAADGLTNAEIGARLFISGRTVERHLTHVYGKLGVTSRVELTRAVAGAPRA